jgi:uncharacterized protein YdcH (DUF465 family)
MKRKNKDKQMLRLTKEHVYYSKKVEEIEKEREKNRDFFHKSLLVKLKKIKLIIKDKIKELTQ